MGGLRTSPVVADFVRDRAGTMSPGAIYEELTAKRLPDMPTLRTVQRLVRETRAHTEPPDSWHPTDADEVRTVGPVLAAMAERLGRFPHMTTAQAQRAAWICRAAPDVPPGEVWTLLAAEDDRLLPYLAFTPWRDKGARYTTAFARGVFGRFVLTPSTEPAFRTWTKKRRAASQEGQPPEGA